MTYESFFGVAALVLSSRSQDDKAKEVEEAFQLFLSAGKEGRSQGQRGRMGDEGEERITVDMLRQVARVLKEDVDEGVLRDMVLEANGGEGVRKGVGRGDFGEVMRRCGGVK